MDRYLLEFRLSGAARKYVKHVALGVAANFDVHGVTHRRVVPHVTLVGPFTTDDEGRLVREFEEVCGDHDLVTFQLSGIRSFGSWLFGKRVLAVNIKPSDELLELRSDLVKRLENFCDLGKHDVEEYKPHATLAFKDIDRKFGRIRTYLDGIPVPPINHHVLRITLLKGTRILREFDLFQRRLLTRDEALSPEIKRTTFRLMKERLGSASRRRVS